MSTGELTIAPPDARQSSARGAHTSARRVPVSAVEVMVAALCCAAAAMALSYAMGRDLNWDYFNYHGYAAFDIFGRRLDQDFFPAGIQGYLNRLPYLPFALMTAAGWHSAAVAAGMAALQSLNLLFLYLIAREVSVGVLRPRLVAATLVLLGGASGAFLLQLGSTFVDPMTTSPVMAAAWLILRRDDFRTLFFAGVLCGAATALKLTNAPFAAGLLAAAMATRVGSAAWIRSSLSAGAGLAAGFALLYGHWAWRLTELHGSPLFPLFNNVFRSPDFATQAVSYSRFVPQTLLDALVLPFRMVEHRSWIYVEVVAPDLRPGLLVVLAAVAVISMAWRRWSSGDVASAAPALPWDLHALRRLYVFFIVSTLGWMVTSSNGRYATPLVLLLAPLIYTTAASLLGVRRAGLLCLLVLPVQVLLIASVDSPRWSPSDWSSRWLPAEVPEELKTSPQLYVSITPSSQSYVAAYVHPASVFVNAIGLSSIPTGGPGWKRFVTLRDHYVGRTRILIVVRPELRPFADEVDSVNAVIDRLGLGINSARCHAMTFNRPETGALPHWWGRRGVPALSTHTVLACDALPVPPSSILKAQRAQAAEVLDAFERKCPGVFAPNQAQVEGDGRSWLRRYGKFDLFFNIDMESGAIYYRMERQATDVVIGNVRTWQRDVERFECRLPHAGRRDISTLSQDAAR